MKFETKYHVTATEKRAIKSIISKGWTAGHTKRKSYSLNETETGYDVTIITKETSDFGRPQTRTSLVRVTQ